MFELKVEPSYSRSLQEAIHKQERIIATYDRLKRKSALINIASFYGHFSAQHARVKDLLNSISVAGTRLTGVPDQPPRLVNTIDHLAYEPGKVTDSLRDALLLISKTEEESYSSMVDTYQKLLRNETKIDFEIVLAAAEKARSQALSLYSNFVEDAY